MYLTQYTVMGLKTFKENLVFEIKTLDIRSFKENWAQLSRREMEEMLKQNIAKSLSIALGKEEINIRSKEVLEYVLKEKAIDELILKSVKALSCLLLHWCNKEEALDYFKKTKENLKETGSKEMTSLEILNEIKEEDLALLNLFRKRVGLGPLSLENLDYSELEEWVK